MFDEYDTTHVTDYEEWKILNIYNNSNIEDCITQFFKGVESHQKCGFESLIHLIQFIKLEIEHSRKIFDIIGHRTTTIIGSRMCHEWFDRTKYTEEDFFDKFNGKHRIKNLYYGYKYDHKTEKNGLYLRYWYLIKFWHGNTILPPKDDSEQNSDNKKIETKDEEQNYVEIFSNLLLGDRTIAWNEYQIKKLGIQSVVNLTNQPSYNKEISFDYPVKDLPTIGIDWMGKCSDYIHDQISAGKKVYVYCSEGISLSPALVIHYLIAYHCMTLNQAYNFVLSKRSIIQPSIGFIKGLIKYEKQWNKLGKELRCFTPIQFRLTPEEEQKLEKQNPPLTKHEYVEIVTFQKFPNLNKNIIIKLHNDIITNRKKYVLDPSVNPNDVYEIGYILIDELIKEYSGYCVCFDDRRFHHPFD